MNELVESDEELNGADIENDYPMDGDTFGSDSEDLWDSDEERK